MKPFQARRPRLWLILATLCTQGVSFFPAERASAQSVSFAQATNSAIPTSARPSSVVSADFDGDGKLDLAVVNANANSVSVLLGRGDGTFATAPHSPFTVVGGLLSNGVPIAVTVGDFNGDGKLDLAVTNIPIDPFSAIGSAITGHVGGGVAIFLGVGDGSFQAVKNFSSGGDFPVALTTGDFDGDGKLDLAVANLNSGSISILRGDGSGSFTFATGSPFSICGRPSSIVAADLNRDTKLDLAVACADDNAVAILMGAGNGTFARNVNSPVAIGLRPSSVALGDLNGDGKLDLVAADLLGSTISVSLGDGTGTFLTVTNYSVGRHPTSIALEDFNRDGKLDVVVTDSLSHMVSVLLGKGDGAFTAAKHFAVENNPQSVAVGDFNGDGEPDLAVANLNSNSVSILLNKTDVVPPTTTATPSPAPNANGWNNTTVNLTLTATDNTGGSGVKEIHYTIGANPPMAVSATSTVLSFTAEGVYSVSFNAVDKAGNIEAVHSLSVQIDETPPSITASQSPLPNGAGWNKSDVTVTFNCSDALSMVDSCTSPILINTDGANQVASGSATDRAGNSATATKSINLDKTAPVLAMPVLATSYTYNASLTLTFGATDALSGLASSQATFNGNTIVSGTSVTLNHPGTNTFTLTATDVAGNTATKTATFSVLYNFTGFSPPIPNDGSGVFKLGRTIPVKFQLLNAQGAPVPSVIASLTVQMASGGTPIGNPIDATAPGNSDIGNLFRYDGAQYIYNFDTKPLSVGTWLIQVHLDDGTVHAVLIGLK